MPFCLSASGTGGASRTLMATSITSPPGTSYGATPARARYMSAPIAYTSARSSTGFAEACSGGMYAGVPMMAPTDVKWALTDFSPAAGLGLPESGSDMSSFRSLARPQSMTTVSPNRPTRILAGLRSRWTIRWLWAYAIASATARRWGRRARRSSSVRASSITSPSGLPEMSFIAKKGSPVGQRPASCTGTIEGCCKRAVMIASRTNRSVSPASEESSSLIATVRFSRVSWAFRMRPIPPSAKTPLTAYAVRGTTGSEAGVSAGRVAGGGGGGGALRKEAISESEISSVGRRPVEGRALRHGGSLSDLRLAGTGVRGGAVVLRCRFGSVPDVRVKTDWRAP